MGSYKSGSQQFSDSQPSRRVPRRGAARFIFERGLKNTSHSYSSTFASVSCGETLAVSPSRSGPVSHHLQEARCSQGNLLTAGKQFPALDYIHEKTNLCLLCLPRRPVVKVPSDKLPRKDLPIDMFESW